MTLAILLATLPVQGPAPAPLAPATGSTFRHQAVANLCGGPAEEIVDSGYFGASILRLDEATGRWEAQAIPELASLSEAQVAVADVDGDGRCDVLHDGGVLFNETPAGSSRFVGVNVVSSLVGAPVSRFVGAPDLDGNGLGDPIFLENTTPWVPYRLRVALQPAPRSLAATVPYSAVRLVAATVVDVDGDGDEDVAVLTEGLRLQVWESGAPTTSPNVIFDAPIASQAFPSYAFDLVAEDLDGDGITDLIVVGSAVEVFRGTGPAAFSPVTPPAPVDRSGDARLVDVDGDGDLDLTVHSGRTEAYSAWPASWIERTGPLQFSGPARVLVDGVLSELVAGDFDGDGEDELAAVRGVIDFGTVDLPVTGGAPAAFQRLRVGAASGPVLADLDLDLDGDNDVVAIDLDARALVVHETIARGETRERVRLPQESTGMALVAGRFGGGATAREVATVRADGTLVVVRDLLAPTGPTVEALGGGYDHSGGALAAFDQDGDGDDDLVVLRDDGTAIDVVRQSAPGVFDPPVVAASALFGTRIEAFVHAELDGTLTRDLVTVEATTAGIVLRLQRGTPVGFIPGSTPASLGGMPIRVRATSVPGTTSGVYVAMPGGGEIVRFGGTPAGALIGPVSIEAFPAGTVVDFDVDRASTLADLHRIVVLENDGASRRLRGHWLTTSTPFVELGRVPASTTWIGLDDVDADGVQDAVLSSNGGVWWARGSAAGSTPITYCAQPGVNSLGVVARLRASYSRGPLAAPSTTLRLDAVDLPPGATTLFLTGRGVAALPGAGGALGTLCLGGTLGRFVAPGQVLTANAGGAAGQDVDPLALPSGGQLLPVAIGDVWAFQAWYRDVDAAGNPVSRLTDAVLATF